MNFQSMDRTFAGLAAATAPSAAEAPVTPALPTGGGTDTTTRFVDSIADAVRATDAKGRDASEKMAAVDRGESDNLVGAMLASQEASLSFALLMQVRNKVVGAVDELIKLQL